MEDGEITDGQISASSEYAVPRLAASNARLNTKIQSGAWAAATNNADQWLQIDLGDNDTQITRVATQGRDDGYNQWVTNYKLQYSDDGVTFQYYREQGKTNDTVKYIWFFTVI